MGEDPARWFVRHADDPLGLAAKLWPAVDLFDRQREIIRSLWENAETVVVAAHQVGKTYAAAVATLLYFLTHQPARVITTGPKFDHLRVLWGELGRLVDTAARPLARERGGPLVVQHREVRKVGCKVSYLLGYVSETGEGMSGHHAEHTLLVVDEASGVEDVVFERGRTWAKKLLALGNPYGNGGWFYRAVRGGDVATPAGAAGEQAG